MKASVFTNAEGLVEGAGDRRTGSGPEVLIRGGRARLEDVDVLRWADGHEAEDLGIHGVPLGTMQCADN
jgi:hypothetical protein